jgi:cytochrome P450
MDRAQYGAAMEALISQRSVSDTEDAERRQRFPRGAALEFDDVAVAGREAALDYVRETEPITWAPAINGWLVTGRDAAREVLARNAGLTVEAEQNLVRAAAGRMMLTVDGDEQARMRKPFEGPFKGSVVKDFYEASLHELVTELIDAFISDREVELDDAFAAPFAIRTAGQSLGLSLDDIPAMTSIYSAIAGGMDYDGDPEPIRRAEAACEQLNEILLPELHRNRLNPGHSLTALLAKDPQGLTDDEIVAQLRVVMFGAIETIQASVLTTITLLLQHPDQLAQVRRDPNLLANTQEEARRLIPPVAFMERWTEEEKVIAGIHIPAHEFIGISVVATNRDPETFPEPDKFDIHRDNSNKGLSFSFGPHACLGIHMARLQTKIAVEQLIGRLPSLELVSSGPASGFAFRRPTNVIVRW